MPCTALRADRASSSSMIGGIMAAHSIRTPVLIESVYRTGVRKVKRLAGSDPFDRADHVEQRRFVCCERATDGWPKLRRLLDALDVGAKGSAERRQVGHVQL